MKLVEKYKITQSQLVPTMFVRMLKLPDDVRTRYDVSSLKGAIHAAAPCPVDVKAKMIEWWGPILIEYYAGSEGNGVTVSTSQQWLTHRGTVGRAVVGKVKILDENDAEAPTGEIGTVYFADAPVFTYHNDPEKTKKAYNDKGWSTLGDVGYLDDEGFLYLTDRKSYMIISGGVNIYPQETEDVLITHPGVADVAVFGVPNEEMGEEVKAVVQPHDMAKAGKELEAELIVFCRKHLSPIKCPKSIDFEAELPRTPTGKLVKRHLRDRYWPKAAVKLAQITVGRAHMHRARPVRCARWWAIHFAAPYENAQCFVMPGLSGIHVSSLHKEDVDGRVQDPAMTRETSWPISPTSRCPPPSAPATSTTSTACACMCWKPASRHNGRPCLLLLHGFPELAFSWRKVMPALAAAGYHVIAPDQRGYGRTTGWDANYDGDLASFRLTNLVRDALGLVSAFGYRQRRCGDRA